MMSDNTPDTPPTPVQADLRKNLRAPLVTLKIRMANEQKVFFGYTKNLSRSGMFVATLKPLDIGQVIDVELMLPKQLNRTAQCRCEVVWTRAFKKNAPYEPGAGFKFIDLSAEIAETIDNWVRTSL